MPSPKTVPLRPGSQLETMIPGRLDRLPWSGWHWRVVIALGVTWILDGLEVTVVGAVAGVLGELETLHLTETEVGLSASAYLLGAIGGALLFGRLTDQLGRKRLFLITLAVYLLGTLATAGSVGFYSFALFRALTGAGIGGEYAAINSAIDELLPARVRGRADLAINSTYWLGTALGASASIFLLDPRYLPHAIGWRLVFGLGALLGAAVVLVRRHVPESPRWYLLHGHVAEAEAVVAGIEAEVERSLGRPLVPPGPAVQVEVKGTVGFAAIGRTLLVRHLRRSVLGLVLMIAQAFAYNAIFFTYALVLVNSDQSRPLTTGVMNMLITAFNIEENTPEAQQMLAEQYKVNADVWSVTSYNELRRNALQAERWNRLHPTEAEQKPYIAQVMEKTEGPIIASTDYMKIVPDQLAPWLNGRLVSLGTDGFGRSDNRTYLRKHFEVNAEAIVAATLSRLACHSPPWTLARPICTVTLPPWIAGRASR